MPQMERTQTTSSPTKQRAPIKVIQSWHIVVFNSLSIPTIIIILQIFFDVVPFYPEIGAFIMAAGAISIVSCFSFVAKYKAVNEQITVTWNETRKLNRNDLRELISKMYFVAGMAEIPSLAGLFYFLATRDLIASFILCMPAIVVAILCHPMLPEQA